MNYNFREHPDESVLLRFLDGELTEREAAELRSHLDGCWQCRRSLGEWQITIDAFLRLRETIQFPSYPPPPKPWAPFDELYPPPAIHRQTRWWRVFKFTVAAMAIAMAVFAAIIVLRKPAKTITIPTTPTPPRALTQPPTVRTSPVPIPAPSVAQPPAVPPSPLHSQILAAQVLHKLGADLGEPVAIVPSSTHAIVRARALEPGRRQAIQDALAALPGVTFENSEPQIAANRTPVPAPPAPQASRPKLFEAELMKRLGSSAAVESFANAVLDDSDTIAIRAHALQTLDSLFPQRTPLPPAERAIVDGIVSAHRAVLRQRVQSLRARLQPYLDMSSPSAADVAPLLARATELDRLLNAAFAGAQVSLTDAALAARIEFLIKELGQ